MTANLSYHSALTPEQICDATKKYQMQRTAAKQRGIPWQFTFETWIAKWLASGQWFNRGCKQGQYVMCRFNDSGPYSPENTRIDTHANNLREAKSAMSPVQRAKLKEAACARVQDPKWQSKQRAGSKVRSQDPAYRAKQEAATRSANSKPYHTPQGDFPSVGAAIKSSGMSTSTFYTRAKADPANYYYLKPAVT